jgi:bisphosphoglycerate-independent phosphoglycerate mutase (AlkP superfamily)
MVERIGRTHCLHVQQELLCLHIFRGDDTEASRIQEKLQALEERAEELDKKRTSTISSISYINDRNRKKNVEGAEKAIKVCEKRNKSFNALLNMSGITGGNCSNFLIEGKET